MKNQYFGDRRDYFKLNLLLDLLDGAELDQLVSVLMLTPNDQTTEGRLTAFDVGAGRPEVHRFLTSAVAENRRQVTELRQFMANAGIRYVPHYDDTFFEHEHRQHYFSALQLLTLDSALIFYDPDIGIDIQNTSSMKRSGLEKYLFKADLERVRGFAPPATLCVAYQHFQANKHRVPGDLVVRARDFGVANDVDEVVSVRDGDVAFLIGSRDARLHASARSAAVQHATVHRRECKVHPRSSAEASQQLDLYRR